MKRLLFTLMIAFMAIGLKAQTTWNVRLGGAFFEGYEDEGYFYYSSYSSYSWDSYAYGAGGATLAIEVNIPFGYMGRVAFSPSILLSSDFADVLHFVVPLHFGYKIPMGNRSLFFPKIGPMVGVDIYPHALVGPSAELAFEIKHFIVAMNGYVGLLDIPQMGVCVTMGYKF